GRVRRLRARARGPRRAHHRRRVVPLAGGGGPLPARRRTGVPVGQPLGHRAPAPRAGGRDLDGDRRPAARRAQLAVPPRPRRPRPGARHRAPRRGLPRGRPGLRRRDHRARDGGDRVGEGRDERLPAAHAGPLHPVDRPPPAGRTRPLPRRPARRDRRRDRLVLRGREQRRLQVRLRERPAGLRARVPRAVRTARRPVRAPRHPALPRRRHDHRGRRPVVGHAGPLRRRLPRPLQVQPAQAHRAAGAVGIHPRPVPDPRLRGHHRLPADQAALLRRAPHDQPLRRGAARAGRVGVPHPARARGARRPPVRRRHPARPGARGRAGAAAQL
ncbi:MAG: Glutathione S-transferase, omega, partial [uncultured Pseudonocardia sp.]